MLIAEGMDEISNVATLDGDPSRLFVLERSTGKVRTIRDGQLLPEPFLDVQDRLVAEFDAEEGLLGLAFPPDFARAPRVYATYVDRDRQLVLSRFDLTPDRVHADTASEQILLTVPQEVGVHLCGHIAFGPVDGLLYVCVGDMQTNEDIVDIAQDLNTSRGKILRIDPSSIVSGGLPTNTSESLAHAGIEIVAYGLRNPWRFAFDPLHGDLFIPDVGRSHWEEINFLPRSAGLTNFGWPYAEGNNCVGQSMTDAGQALGGALIIWGTGNCADLAMSWPIFEYTHDSENCAVIGGQVYRGARDPAWHGVFVFADFCSGKIWALRGPQGEPEVRLLVDSETVPYAIGADPHGEIVVADGPNGAAYRLSFPDDPETGWRSVDDVLLDNVLEVRRAGTSHAKEALDSVLQSRRWQLADQLGGWYEWIRAWFDS